MKLNTLADTTKKSQPNIGLKIQKLLDLHNVGLSKVASATGLTSETIRQIINGTIKNPGIETLSKIAEAFSVSLFDLLETRDVTEQITKKKIKIIDIFDLQKLPSEKHINDLITQSIESTEIAFIDENALDADFFAVQVNATLAEKLTNCGMPMLKQGDLLIFLKDGSYATNSICLAKCNTDALVLGIMMEIEDKHVWIKSVDIPQKQIVMKINKKDLAGIVHNVQFIK